MKYYLACLQVLTPFVIGTLLVVLAVVEPKGQFQLYIPILGPFLAFQYNASGLAVQVLLILFALVLFAIPVLRDYSNWLPAYMRFKMFFDVDGIHTTLLGFSEQECKELGIKKGWEEDRKQYLQEINNSLWLLANQNASDGALVDVEFTDETNGLGEFVYRVRLVQGWQKYQIEDAWGYAWFSFPRGQNTNLTLRCLVTMVPTFADRIHVTFRDVYTRHCKILRPQVGLDVPISPVSDRRIAHVVLATKVDIFPVPKIGKTLYLVNKEQPSGTDALDQKVNKEQPSGPSRRWWARPWRRSSTRPGTDALDLKRSMIPIAYGVYNTD